MLLPRETMSVPGRMETRASATRHRPLCRPLDHAIQPLVEVIDAGLHVAHRAHDLVLHLAHAVARDIGFRGMDLVLSQHVGRQARLRMRGPDRRSGLGAHLAGELHRLVLGILDARLDPPPDAGNGAEHRHGKADHLPRHGALHLAPPAQCLAGGVMGLHALDGVVGVARRPGDSAEGSARGPSRAA